MTLTLAKWTIEEYQALVATGVLRDRHVELLDGLIVEMPPEGPEHAYLGEEAAVYLRRTLGERARVREVRPITLIATGSEPEPDISVVHPLREVYYQRHPYAEEVFLIIEFSKSSLDKDLKTKRQTYATAGITDYWVANLQDRELIIHRNSSDGNYQSVERLRDGLVSLLAFPDVTLRVKSLLQR